MVSAEEKFEACCMLASITGRDITKLCYNIVSDSWLAVEEKKSRASLDMDMVCRVTGILHLDLVTVFTFLSHLSLLKNSKENIENQAKLEKALICQLYLLFFYARNCIIH